jgi:hypothetical protein
MIMKAKIFFLLFLFALNSFAQPKKQVASSDSVTLSSVCKTIDTTKAGSQNIIVQVEGEEKDWKDVWLPVIVALIVAFAAYKGVIKQSKATSISGFRVNWIEDLRVSYSKFLIALRNVDNKIRSGVINPKVYSKDEDEEDLQFLKTKIKLLLNNNATTNPDHVDFYQQLIQYMEEHKKYYRGEMTEKKAYALEAKKSKMEEVLADIFKKEWEKAKRFG